MTPHWALSRVDGSPVETPIEPVTVAEALAHCRADSHESAYIAQLITAARAHCENLQSSAIVQGDWELSLDSFPRGCIQFPIRPVQQVTSIKYLDKFGAWQTLDTLRYIADTVSFTPRISGDWPTTADELGAVVVAFRAGYASGDVPATIKQAILLLVGHWFDSRSAAAPKPSREIQFAVSALLGPDTIRL